MLCGFLFFAFAPMPTQTAELSTSPKPISLADGKADHCVKSVQIRSFFWFVFLCIRTEYGGLLRKSLYLVQIQKNKDQKKTPYLDIFHAVDSIIL